MKKLLVGPVLGLESDTRYTVCFSTPTNINQAKLLVDGAAINCVKAGITPSSILWRGEIPVTLQAAAQWLNYQVELDGAIAQCKNGRQQWRFFVPGKQEPPTLAYASCNGFSSLDLMHKTQKPYELWQRMADKQPTEPLSLLMLGGDQLYADSIWSEVNELKKWNALPHDEKIKRQASKTLKEQLERFYDKLYQDRWSTPAMSLMLATVPSLMMWDDHDIFDGWGSFPNDLLNCNVFQAIYQTARRYFELFQIRSKHNQSLLDTNASHYAYALRFRDYNILALDNRAERTLQQVMSESQWTSINNYLSNTANDGHLLVLSAVPVVYRDFSFTESIMDHTPWEEELTDDLKDHWRAKEHQGERARLIHRLLDNAAKRKANPMWKTVILSGDVHIGSIGVINDRSRDCKIHQVVSSGIVHPAPSRLQWIGIMAVTNDRDEHLDEEKNIEISMLKPFASDQYIRSRNYITLLVGTDKKLWVNWESEGKDKPYYPVH